MATPKQRWSVNRGWWGVWLPFLIYIKILTHDNDNDNDNDNKGLSALGMRSGKTLWRIGSICDEGRRSASMCEGKFFDLDRNSVLFTLGGDDGKPVDYYVMDINVRMIPAQSEAGEARLDHAA